ncbi:MAG TPA: sulfurtransferase TusA family protein [Rhodospirillales bacterium]|nr:sulfurtransferase TusA family protein [Rhodospirillales bacterium]
MAKTTLDARGLICPLPVLRAKRKLNELAPGDILEIFATDPNAKTDITSLCASNGHELVESGFSEGVFTLVVRKAG